MTLSLVLLTPVEDPQPYIRDTDRWWAQPKYDGQRVQVAFGGGNPTQLWSRTGRALAPWPAINTPPAVVDGELVENTLVLFDLLERGGVDYRRQPYADRFAALVRATSDTPFQLAVTARTPEEKMRLFVALVDAQAEGIVFRDQRMWYQPGRTWAGLKHKFVSTVTAEVVQQNVRRSVQVALAAAPDSTERVVVGDVTVPPNRAIPAVGDLVEVRYLYAVRGSDKLFQPVLLRVRDDVPVDALSALRYRGARK